jgi:hypothetical protein
MHMVLVHVAAALIQLLHAARRHRSDGMHVYAQETLAEHIDTFSAATLGMFLRNQEPDANALRRLECCPCRATLYGSPTWSTL